ncbi:hypothetical protein JOC95_002034 [Bacillus tianshenii]|uniref:Uncharacterized protein n=1 Tax=Sutcliffiella tianshenii TaxID=1463404 RepID=A0ABS2NZX4_9BACI|nr:hypothetical protein [Bacillus tianshenii]MBM7620181.1 hypothetical protein [Bacillus tianshenii]
MEQINGASIEFPKEILDIMKELSEAIAILLNEKREKYLKERKFIQSKKIGINDAKLSERKKSTEQFTNPQLYKPKSRGIISKSIMTVKEFYEGKVAVESLTRAGRNPQLHGIVHEVMYRDKLNVKNLISGTKTVLSKSKSAIRDDLLVKKGTKIVGRMQLKDTVNSIDKTIKQVKNGKYSRTLLIGTKETTKAFQSKVAIQTQKGIKITQKMHSSGISSSDTTRIAQRALGKIGSINSLSNVAKKSAFFGAAVSAGLEAFSSAGDYINGNITGKEYAKRIIKEGTEGGVTAAVSTTSGILATAGTTLGLASLGISSATLVGASAVAVTALPIAAGIAVSIGVGSAVKKFFKGFW